MNTYGACIAQNGTYHNHLDSLTNAIYLSHSLLQENGSEICGICKC